MNESIPFFFLGCLKQWLSKQVDMSAAAFVKSGSSALCTLHPSPHAFCLYSTLRNELNEIMCEMGIYFYKYTCDNILGQLYFAVSLKDLLEVQGCDTQVFSQVTKNMLGTLYFQVLWWKYMQTKLTNNKSILIFLWNVLIIKCTCLHFK